jgi:predicted ribosome quality control (RQC) complex YloA/Tae2 family protein
MAEMHPGHMLTGPKEEEEEEEEKKKERKKKRKKKKKKKKNYYYYYYIYSHIYQDFIVTTHYCIVFYHFNNS